MDAAFAGYWDYDFRQQNQAVATLTIFTFLQAGMNFMKLDSFTLIQRNL